MTDSHAALGLSTVIVQLPGVSLLERPTLVIVGERGKGLSAAVHWDNNTFYISISTGWIVFEGMQCGLTAAIVTQITEFYYTIFGWALKRWIIPLSLHWGWRFHYQRATGWAHDELFVLSDIWILLKSPGPVSNCWTQQGLHICTIAHECHVFPLGLFWPLNEW